MIYYTLNLVRKFNSSELLSYHKSGEAFKTKDIELNKGSIVNVTTSIIPHQDGTFLVVYTYLIQED